MRTVRRQLDPATARRAFRRRVASRVWLGLLCAVALTVSSLRPVLAQDPPPEAKEAYERQRRGEYALALRAAESATRRYPQDPLAWRVHGWVLSQQGRHGPAAEAYQHAARLDPNDAVAWNNLAVAYLNIGDAQEALRALGQALRVLPRYADALNNRGVALERLEREREALRQYEAAARADPDHVIALNNLGARRMAVGDMGGARRVLVRASQLEPGFAAVRLNLVLLRDPGATNASTLEQLEAEARRPDAPPEIRRRALLARAAHAHANEGPEAARAIYLEALQLTPNDPLVLNNIAVVEDELGMDRQALMHLDMAMRASPDSRIAQNNIGIVHVHRGDLERAEAVFRDLVASDPRFHRGWYNLGVVLGGRGAVSEAREAMQKAVRLAPRDADARYNLGLLDREVGASIHEEKASYEEALRLDDALAEAHLALGALLADPESPARLRDERRARHHLERFLAMARPDDASGIEQAPAVARMARHAWPLRQSVPQ